MSAKEQTKLRACRQMVLDASTLRLFAEDPTGPLPSHLFDLLPEGASIFSDTAGHPYSMSNISINRKI